MMSKNSIVPFLKDYLIKFLTRPFLLDTNEQKNQNSFLFCLCHGGVFIVGFPRITPAFAKGKLLIWVCENENVSKWS